MAEVITVIKDGKVMTKGTDRYVTIKSQNFGDCTVCWETMDLKKNLRTGDETMICSNSLCDYEVKLKEIKWFN